ncbi:MAG: replication-relaxation family protein [Ktedonobacteraceae bacterium]|nr:replication-relaxation family protein [Ktedonobacteraceae bacterium]
MSVIRAFRMRPIYDLLLRGTTAVPVGLYHLQMATAEQLCRLHYSPGSIKAIKARLKTLVDNGFLQTDSIPTKLFKSPFYYALDTAGMRYLASVGFDTHESWRAQKEMDKHSLFIEHSLELNDILISAALVHRVDERYRLEGFIHERVLKRQPLTIDWKDDSTGKKERFTVIPDAYVDFQTTGTKLHLRLLLEHDRGTEGQHFFRKRIRAYIGLVKTGNYKRYFTVDKLTVAFTTFAGDARVRQMRAWTEQELKRTDESWEVGSVFTFTGLSQPTTATQAWIEPRWQLAYAEHAERYSLLVHE